MKRPLTDVYGAPYNDFVPTGVLPPLGWRALRYRVLRCWLKHDHYWQFSVLRPRLQIWPPIRICAVCGRVELDDYDYITSER